ncbi:unnamed protein product [Knipowitschia caucasica]
MELLLVLLLLVSVWAGKKNNVPGIIKTRTQMNGPVVVVEHGVALNHTEDQSLWSYSEVAGLRCFLPEEVVETRIVGGEEAWSQSWPWQVSLSFVEMPACGGAILSPLWVISAAHCFKRYKKASLWTVLAGKHNLDNLNETRQQVVAVSRIISHTDYNPRTKEHDIALLKLQKRLVFNEFVRPIHIWMRSLPLFTECTITGWGSSRENGPRMNKLQEVNVTILPTDVCNKYYAGQILNTMFCAGKEEGGADACQGDSGGPLSCFNGSRYELIGTVSWGVGCGRAKKPGVYTKLQDFVPWITDVTNGTPDKAPKTEDQCGKQKVKSCEKVPLPAAMHQSEDGLVSVLNISESCPSYWPWQVSIQYRGHHYCSGTLIHEKFVITAQHCHVSLEDQVVLGIHDLEYSSSRGVPIQKVINLRRDRSFPPGFDLALIELSVPARLGRNVAPICVPDEEEDGDLDSSWSCVVTGWGSTQSSGVNPSRLHHTAVTLVNQTTCREKWGQDTIKDSHICCHPAASTSCLGDSGAPLFCRKRGSYFLFGVVTWSRSKCNSEYPAVFTRVPHFSEWISETTGD